MNRRGLMGMMAALPVSGITLSGVAQASAPAASGRLVHHEPVPVAAPLAPRGITVWLPPGYDHSDARYPVLYMHDGQNLFDAASTPFGAWGVDAHLTRLIADGQVRAPIVVGINNTPQRLRDYVPANLIAALPDDMKAEVTALYGGAPLSDAYLDFVTRTLKPFIDSTYRTLPGPSDTTIAGSSMGGLISLYAVMRHPDVFSAAACLSTHWPLKLFGDDTPADFGTWRDRLLPVLTQVLEADLPAPGRHRFYFDHGDATLDRVYPDFQRHVDSVFRRQGYGPDALRSLAFPGAAHNEIAWNQRLDVPLTFLLSPAPTRNP